MAKTFNTVHEGSLLILKAPEWFSNGFNKVHDFVAEVTNVDIYGDELIISYKTHQYNHTIRVHKCSTCAYVHIEKRKYRNYKYYHYTKDPYWINIYKGGVPKNYKSDRKYRKTGETKYAYKIEII